MSPLIMIVLAVVASIVLILFALGSASESSDDASKGDRTNKPDDSQKNKEKLRERLIRAGIYRRNSVVYFYISQFAFASIPVGLTYIGYTLAMFSLNMALLAGVITGILGVVAPGMYLDWQKAKRQTLIRRSIPDALDVITICVEAGLTLSSAIARVASDLQSTYPLLAQELTIVHRQTRMGNYSPGEALASFAERFDLREIRSLASVVTQSEKFGASIAGGLRTHGEHLREKRMQQAHERAQKAAVWILLPTVTCIFPALFVVILGPAFYNIAEMLQTTGR